MTKSIGSVRNGMLLAGLLAGSILLSVSLPSSAQAGEQGLASNSAGTDNWHGRIGEYYKRNWGIDIVGVRRVASGSMLEFSYRVLNPGRAKPLNEKRTTAYMIDDNTGIKLTVPQMEKVGLLRTTTAPQTNRVYWMVFANQGDLVKTGSHVSVVIGEFHVGGLIVK